MRCAAISWRNPDGVGRPTDGIHLVWTGPELIELSLASYKVERREVRPTVEWDCDAHDAASLDLVRANLELPARFGKLLYRLAPPFRLIAAVPVPPKVPPPGEAGSPGKPSSTSTALRAFGVTKPAPLIEVFTLELLAPANQVRVRGTAKTTFAIALSEGNVVDVQWASGGKFDLVLKGELIDSVMTYGIALTTLTICLAVSNNEIPWRVIATNLGLPVTPVGNQWSIDKPVARARLLPGESISDDSLDRLGDLLQLGLQMPEDGAPRPGSRVLLMRNSLDEPFEETTLTSALDLVRIAPAWRRATGFAHSDLEANQLPGNFLNQGGLYEYRVSGLFRAEDLQEAIYDFHAVPGGTRLPAAFYIRDLAFRCAVPPLVVFDPPPPDGVLTATSRRGLRIDQTMPPTGSLPQQLHGAVVVVGFPNPVTTIALDVSQNHQLEIADSSGLFSLSMNWTVLAGGPRAAVTFTHPVSWIALRGIGTLFSVRISPPSPDAPGTLIEATAWTGPVLYQATSLGSPSLLTIENLQRPPAIVSGPIDESTPVQPRHDLGFRLEWIGPVSNDIDWWPSDLAADWPVDALAYQIEHQSVQPPSTAWEPLQEDENLIFATTADNIEPPPLVYGVDLDEVFIPRWTPPPGGSLAMHFTDIFPADGPPRASATPGTMHIYRIHALDIAGRVSDSWTYSNAAILEKHLAPPLPCGPNIPTTTTVLDADGNPVEQRIAPDGVFARVIVADPNLTPPDQLLLGSASNAIVLNWGWGANERGVDPLAKEFRIYSLSKPPDFVPGMITSVTPNIGTIALGFTTDRVLRPNDCAGQWIDSHDHPFLVVSHGGGTSVTLEVATPLLDGAPLPLIGPANMGRPLAPEHVRPPEWDTRVAVIPITSADTYQYVFHDLLHPSAAVPNDTVWVGVSAADNESYVPDELPDGLLPGNEGGIAICTVNLRYKGRPTYARPDPLGDVPEIRTDEPTGRQVLVFLDLPAILNDTLPDALQAGEPVVIDRCSAETLLTISSVESGAITMRRNDNTTQTIVFPNPGDQQHVVDVLSGNRRTTIETRYLLYLATQFDERSEIFERVGTRIESFGVVDDLLDPKPQRHFYRVRRADAAGHVSLNGAILPCVVRVPSTAPAKAPEKVRATYDHTASTLQVEIKEAPDPEIAYLLFFFEIAPVTSKPVEGRGALLRVPNRPDLYPAGLRLRSPGGALLVPLVKSLADSDVTAGADGWPRAVVDLPVTSVGWMRYWCAAITVDGIPSAPIGPFTVGVGEAP
jgi:hypothetical protein